MSRMHDFMHWLGAKKYELYDIVNGIWYWKENEEIKTTEQIYQEFEESGFIFDEESINEQI